jgi:hypothetical protein
MAFFEGWVEGRYWNYRSNRYNAAVIKAYGIAGGEPPDSTEVEDIPDLTEGAATFRFHYGITSSYPPQPHDLLISVWGYDKVEAQALLADQKEALRVVLRCEPLWQYRHNLMEIYGLPITQHELTAFLPGGKLR